MTAAQERPAGLDRLLTTEELAAFCHVPADTVRYWRFSGTGPRGFKLGRRVMYSEAEVALWLRARQAADQSA
jgi:predicted DNA-binding transcriptional regulator AlpA